MEALHDRPIRLAPHSDMHGAFQRLRLRQFRLRRHKLLHARVVFQTIGHDQRLPVVVGIFNGCFARAQSLALHALRVHGGQRRLVRELGEPFVVFAKHVKQVQAHGQRRACQQQRRDERRGQTCGQFFLHRRFLLCDSFPDARPARCGGSKRREAPVQRVPDDLRVIFLHATPPIPRAGACALCSGGCKRSIGTRPAPAPLRWRKAPGTSRAIPPRAAAV